MNLQEIIKQDIMRAEPAERVDYPAEKLLIYLHCLNEVIAICKVQVKEFKAEMETKLDGERQHSFDYSLGAYNSYMEIISALEAISDKQV